ncbi:ribose-5-phosphate isomerase RpiA [soil metagenome]
MTVAQQALEMVRENTVIGLGTGRAATAFIRLLGDRVRSGFRIRGVATSERTADFAKELGIPLSDLEDVENLETTFDGADAVDPRLDLIKGLGGALVREKIVAAASKRLVILVGSEKVTDALGHGYCKTLPIEVVPFGLPFVVRRLAHLGLVATVRRREDGDLFLTDNHNYTLDCDISASIDDPTRLEQTLRTIPGIVDSGLFLGMADTILIQHDNGTVEARHRDPAQTGPA